MVAVRPKNFILVLGYNIGWESTLYTALLRFQGSDVIIP
jgi:hypothetical protein